MIKLILILLVIILLIFILRKREYFFQVAPTTTTFYSTPVQQTTSSTYNEIVVQEDYEIYPDKTNTDRIKYYTDSSDLEFGYDNSTIVDGQQDVLLEFDRTGLEGQYINEAILKFYFNQEYDYTSPSEQINEMIIVGVKNISTTSTTTANTNRTDIYDNLTSNLVNWDVSSYNDIGTFFISNETIITSPDISPILNELIENSGKKILILIKPRITTNIPSSYRKVKVYSKNKNSGEYSPIIQYKSTPLLTTTSLPANTSSTPPTTSALSQIEIDQTILDNMSNISDANRYIIESGRQFYVKTPATVGNILSIGRDLELDFVSENPNPSEYYKSRHFNVGTMFFAGNDNEFIKAKICNLDTEFISKDFINFDPISGILGKDRVCDELTMCNPDTQYILNPHSSTTDRTCADLPICSKTKKLVGNTSTQPGRCEDIGEIIVIINIANTNNLFIKTKTYNGSNNVFNTVNNIKDYYRKLSTVDDKYSTINNITSELIVGLDFDSKSILNDRMPCYYKVVNNFVSYIFDLRNEVIKNHFYKKHKYLNISSIEKLHKNIDGPLYLFVLGKDAGNEPMGLFGAKNVCFSILYKDQEEANVQTTNKYIFEDIKYDLNIFYEYNKEVSISINSNNSNYINQFINKILVSKVVPDYKNIVYNKESASSLNVEIQAYYRGLKYSVNQSSQSLIRCNFDAFGDSLFQCKDTCKNLPNCSTIDCNLICENCNSNNCLWTIKQKINIDLLSPDHIKVKGFAGDSLIKLTWMKPNSPSEILRYYIVITSPIDTEYLQIYSLFDNRELCEYLIPDLENEKPYDVYVFAKNNIGVSKKSNKITIVPNKNSDLKIENNDSYSNSIENYYKTKGITFDLKKQASNYERKSVIQDLKNILREELKIKVPTQSFFVNVF